MLGATQAGDNLPQSPTVDFCSGSQTVSVTRYSPRCTVSYSQFLYGTSIRDIHPLSRTEDIAYTVHNTRIQAYILLSHSCTLTYVAAGVQQLDRGELASK